MRKVLHAGCDRSLLPSFFQDCEEVRLDINADVKPDIVASITAMGDIGPFEAVFCSHTVEHLRRFEVGVALREFRRVLSEGGVAVVVVPDLEGLVISADQVMVKRDGCYNIVGVGVRQ